mgnify:CR=1 FL=1
MKRKAVAPSPPSAASARPAIAWSDFHLVLAVARHGSVARACGPPGMTHATPRRKLDAIEGRLGARLFVRSRGGYELTAAGIEIEQAASAFEPLALAAQARVRGEDLRPAGHVRVSAAAILIEYLADGVLSQFGAAFPDVRIELAASRDHASPSRREADVAIRVADEVPDWLVGRKLGHVQFRIYGLRQAGARAQQHRIEDLVSRPAWIGFERDARELKFDRWLAATVPDASVRLRVSNFSAALAMVLAGLGIALLPAFLEARVPQLRPLSAPSRKLRTPLWLVTPPDLRNTMRIKVLLRAFGPALANALQAAQDGPAAG